MSNKKWMHFGEDEALTWENDGKKHAVRVLTDEYPESPREWDNIATMACFHKRYLLGDKIDEKEPSDLWKGLVRRIVPGDVILEKLLAGKITGIRAELVENDRYDIYELFDKWIGGGKFEKEESLAYSSVPVYAVKDYIADDLTISDCQTLLHPYLVSLPLWLYDHSGITMSCGDREYPYNDRWDSGLVGWIFIEKQKLFDSGVCDYVLDEKGDRIRTEYGYQTKPITDDNWRNRAIQIMEDEVEIYDSYLRGDVYGFKLYEYDEDTDDWEEEDSCFGFYGDNFLESGVLDEIGYGLMDAINNENYKIVSVQAKKTVTYSFG